MHCQEEDWRNILCSRISGTVPKPIIKSNINLQLIAGSMKKRGSIAVNTLIVIILSALIVASFYNIGKAYGTEEVFYKFAVAKDLAIHLDLIYSLPGDIEYIYPNDVSK